jgi:hypothetical protein
MALKYILDQIGAKMGMNPSVDGERGVMLRFVNEAAKELYHMSDMAGCLEEQYFKINPNQTLALPHYVGHIRAMREAYQQQALTLSQMRPRYNQFNWEGDWKNWRLKGLQTLQTSLTNQSNLVIKVAQVENPPVVINITGPTVGSSNVSETVTMTSMSMTTVNQFLDVASFTKTTVNACDVILCDIDNNQISYIPNNELKASFQIVDISTSPWYPPNINPLLGWVEVLYKKALIWFQNDNDEFPAVGYDNIIVNKCLQLYYEEQTNPQLAMSYYQKANQSLAQIHEDANRGTDDVVALVAHPHDCMNPRVGFGRDWKYAYRITGR